ncbi:hypothetical protein Tco_0490957 [Tanacetum coccineum]
MHTPGQNTSHFATTLSIVQLKTRVVVLYLWKDPIRKLADILTKVLAREIFEFLIKRLAKTLLCDVAFRQLQAVVRVRETPGRRAGNEFAHDPNPFPYDNTPDFYDQPPHPQYETYSCELCGNDSHYGYDCPPRFPLVYDIPSFINPLKKWSKEGKDDSSKTLDTNLVVTESNETESERHVSSSRSGKDTHAKDADVNSVNDKQPMAEVQLFAEHNILANEQQHSEQSESVYDTYLLEKVDINTIPKSTDTSHRGGEIDQNVDAEKCQVSFPLLDPSFDNITTKFSNQFLESENISLKKTVAQLQKDFSRMETHCVNMELKYQNQVLKNGQHGQILKETSNKAKIKKEIEVLETNNIELDHSVAKLLAENKKLHKENEHLKQTYKDLYDSIKKTRVQTKDHNDSLIAQINSKTVENVDLKAQIQEKNIESKDSYVSNLDEPALLVTPLSDVNEDECFDPGGDEIEACLTSDSIPSGIDGANFDPEGDILLLEKLLNDDPSSPLPPKELYYEDLKVIQSSIDTSPDFEDDYYDSEGDIIYLESLLNNDTIPYLPSEVFLDHDPNNLKDEPDLKSIVKVFDPGIHEKKISPTYVSLPFEDRHYLSFTYVIRIFLPYFTYPVESPFLLSSGSEDTIFDPGIPVFSLEPVVSHRSGTFMCFNVYLNILNESPIEICSSTCFVPNISMIWGESS